MRGRAREWRIPFIFRGRSSLGGNDGKGRPLRKPGPSLQECVPSHKQPWATVIRTPGSGIPGHSPPQPWSTASLSATAPYTDGHQSKMTPTWVYLPLEGTLSHRRFWGKLWASLIQDVYTFKINLSLSRYQAFTTLRLLFSLPNWPYILWFAALTLHCGNALSPKNNQR